MSAEADTRALQCAMVMLTDDQLGRCIDRCDGLAWEQHDDDTATAWQNAAQLFVDELEVRRAVAVAHGFLIERGGER